MPAILSEEAIIKKKSSRLVGLKPIVNSSSKVLILGSMASVIALKKQEYYGNPLNHFWKILSRLLRTPPPLTYQEKLKILSEHHIALWDVVDTCQRKGSSDANICEAKFNDIEGFLKKYPNIQAIFLTGKTVAGFFKKSSAKVEIPVYILPSPSPAFVKPIEWKVQGWRPLLQYIN